MPGSDRLLDGAFLFGEVAHCGGASSRLAGCRTDSTIQTTRDAATSAETKASVTQTPHELRMFRQTKAATSIARASGSARARRTPSDARFGSSGMNFPL